MTKYIHVRRRTYPHTRRNVSIFVFVVFLILLLAGIANAQECDFELTPSGSSPICLRIVPTWTPTSTPAGTVPTVTPTPTETLWPTATNTPEPTATPTPDSQVSISPYPSAPACADHDDTAAHGLWDYAAGCHYDHAHHPIGLDLRNAAQLALEPVYDVFWRIHDTYCGGAVFGCLSETYRENELKHDGYRVNVDARDECVQDVRSGVNCVMGWLLIIHDVGGAKAHVTKVHSLTRALRICDASAENCGVMYETGHTHWGQAGCPYKVQRHVLPDDPPEMDFQLFGSDPYRMTGIEVVPQPWHSDPLRAAWGTTLWSRVQNGKPVHTVWTTVHDGMVNRVSGYAGGFYGYDISSGIFYRILDHQGGCYRDDAQREHYICDSGSDGAFDCHYNNSVLTIFQVWADILPEWDGSALDTEPRAGFVSMETYKTRTGQIDTSCTEYGLHCLPFVLDGVPVGFASWNQNTSGTHPDQTTAHNSDICFDAGGQWVPCNEVETVFDLAGMETGRFSGASNVRTSGWLEPYRYPGLRVD